MSIKDAYLGLVTSQHRDKPKYMAMITALLGYMDDIWNIAIYLQDEFDLDNAVGAQQDMLGVIVGQNRTVDFQPDRGLSPVLDNYAYKNLLKATVAKNMWKGGIEELKEVWKNLFGYPIIIQDNQDMTIDVVVVGIHDQITKNLIQKGYIVPKPQGVGINYAFSEDAVFGYDMETSSIKGYDHATWINPVSEDSFSYDMHDEKDRLFGYDESYWT